MGAADIPYEAPPPEAFLTDALIADGVRLRPQGEADLDFIRELYVSHRWEELQRMPGWTDAQRQAFLNDQARLQWRHYAKFYYDAQFLIAERLGERIGRLYLFHNNRQDLRIVEIGFVREWRGHGYGSALLGRVQAFARAAGKTCSIHVEQTNPARRLYHRLGFAEVSSEGPYVLLEWHPEGLQQKTA